MSETRRVLKFSLQLVRHSASLGGAPTGHSGGSSGEAGRPRAAAPTVRFPGGEAATEPAKTVEHHLASRSSTRVKWTPGRLEACPADRPHGQENLEAACERAVAAEAFSYRSVRFEVEES